MRYPLINAPTTERTLRVLVLASLLLACGALAASNGVIKGTVVHRSTGRVFPGVTVTLEWESDGKLVRQQTTTDAEGMFVFQGLPVDNTTAMTLSATVNGKAIRREGVALSTWTPEVVADLEIFEASGNPERVHVGRLTTIFTPSDAPEVVPIIEFWEIHNDEEVPFAQTDASGRSVGFVIHLPEGAMNAQIEGEQTPAEIEGTTIRLTQPLPPRSTFVSVSYVVPKAGHITLRRPVAFPIEEALVLSGGGAWVVTSREFTKGEPAEIHGAKYETFTRQQIAKGTTFEIALKKGKRKSGTVDEGSQSNTALLLVLVAIGSVAAGGLMGSWLVQARMPKPPLPPKEKRTIPPNRSKRAPSAAMSKETDLFASLSRDDLEAAKRVYLTLIAQLDEFHNDGEVPEAVYRQLRDEQKAALGRILAHLNA